MQAGSIIRRSNAEELAAKQAMEAADTEIEAAGLAHVISYPAAAIRNDIYARHFTAAGLDEYARRATDRAQYHRSMAESMTGRQA